MKRNETNKSAKMLQETGFRTYSDWLQAVSAMEGLQERSKVEAPGDYRALTQD